MIRYPQRQVDDWNAKVPPGSTVRRYRLMLPRREPMGKFITKGPAFVLGGHNPVVQLEGVSGCFSLDCLEVLA